MNRRKPVNEKKDRTLRLYDCVWLCIFIPSRPGLLTTSVNVMFIIELNRMSNRWPSIEMNMNCLLRWFVWIRMFYITWIFTFLLCRFVSILSFSHFYCFVYFFSQVIAFNYIYQMTVFINCSHSDETSCICSTSLQC